jgi:RNA polymerase sigma-70 factor (ECF subfamily)
MTPAARAALEVELAAKLAARDFAGAATLALRGYGAEIYSLLSSLHRAHHDADEAFSIFCEALWKGLPGFAGRSSFRTWAYTVARHASCRLRERDRGAREVLVTSSAFEEMALAVRTASRSRLQRAQTQMQKLRETLPPDDQLLLILRVDRELDWKDLARVMNEDGTLDEAALARESARLRQRFQSIKERLRELAQSRE